MKAVFMFLVLLLVVGCADAMAQEYPASEADGNNVCAQVGGWENATVGYGCSRCYFECMDWAETQQPPPSQCFFGGSYGCSAGEIQAYRAQLESWCSSALIDCIEGGMGGWPHGNTTCEAY